MGKRRLQRIFPSERISRDQNAAILLDCIHLMALRRNIPKTTAPGDQLLVKAERSSSGLFVGEELFVDAARSPNGHFDVAARDHSYAENNREIRGECVLADAGGSVLFRKSIRRANNPHVTDDGLVIVEDWKGEKLSSALLAIDVTGKAVWSHNFRANVGNSSGISADGTRAFVMTFRSDCEAHSEKTFLLDAANGRTIWTVDRKSHGWADVRFEGNRLVALVSVQDESTVEFPFDDSGFLGQAYEDARRRARGQRQRGQ